MKILVTGSNGHLGKALVSQLNANLHTVNEHARNTLGWTPEYTFACCMARLAPGMSLFSPLAESIGKKGYHAQTFADGPYPLESSCR